MRRRCEFGQWKVCNPSIDFTRDTFITRVFAVSMHVALTEESRDFKRTRDRV